MNDAASTPENEAAGDMELLEDEAVVEPDAVPEPDAEPETDAEPEADAEPAPEPDAEPLTLDELVADLAEPDTIAETPADATPEAAPHAEPEPDAALTEATGSEAEQAGEPAEASPIPTPLLGQLWTRAPFWAVDAVWFVLTVAAVIVLWRSPSGTFADGLPYAILVLGGAALAFIGVGAGLVVWLTARSRATQEERVGLGLALWTRALAWTAGGVAMWWVGILLLDLHHSGLIG